MQIVFPIQFLDIPHVVDYANALGQSGASVGYLRDPTHGFVVVDDAHALIPLEVRTAVPTAIVTAESHLCRSLLELGRRIDSRALCETDARTARHLPHLTPAQKRVLELLHAGMTDASAARKLGITDRTMRRHVAGIYGLLGARSRFEAGAKAVAHGLI